MRWVAATILAATLAAAPDWSRRAEKASQAVLAQAAHESPALGIDSRLRAAEMLRETHPQLARKFLLDVAAAIVASKDTGSATRRLTQLLLSIDEAEAARLAPGLPNQSSVQDAFLAHWMGKEDWARAVEVAHASLRKGVLASNQANLLSRLKEKDPERVPALFREMLAALPPAPALEDALALLRAMPYALDRDPEGVRLATLRLLEAARPESFNREGRQEVLHEFKFGGAHIDTSNGRETVLAPAAMYLWVLDPQAYRENQELFAGWNEHIRKLTRDQLAKAATPSAALHTIKSEFAKGVKLHPDAGSKPQPDYAKMPFREASEKLRSTPTGLASLLRREDLSAAETDEVMRAVLSELPRAGPYNRLRAARDGLRICAERGTKRWIKPAAAALLAALVDLEKCATPECERARENFAAGEYAFLAETARLERLRLPRHPSLAARTALLELRDAVEAPFDFALTSPDGERNTLQQYRGKVVLLNFWATW